MLYLKIKITSKPPITLKTMSKQAQERIKTNQKVSIINITDKSPSRKKINGGLNETELLKKKLEDLEKKFDQLKNIQENKWRTVKPKRKQKKKGLYRKEPKWKAKKEKKKNCSGNRKKEYSQKVDFSSCFLRRD